MGRGIYRREIALGSLQGAVALVTGASRGLGAAIAEELGRGGAKVVVNYSGSQEPAEEVAAGISKAGSGGRAAAIQADVADPEDAQRLIDETVERFGRLDVLVNNAGINIDRTIKRLSLEDWYKVLQVDLNGCFHTVHAALPHMIEQEFGRIINMSSFVGEAGNVGQANYAAAKSGLFGFTKTAALELARYNITVNAISPGFIETEMVAAIPESAKEKILEQIPLGRLGKPEDIAKAVRYVVEDADYMTGNILDINGGVYMR
jgi:NAD(P)-dependent dehydrogenase (short-subunit alcohol dehydrogenase family)